MAGGLIRLAQGASEVSASNPLYVSGGGSSDATAANQVTGNNTLTSIDTGVSTHRLKVLAANDCLKTFTWLDHGTSDVRPSTIVYSSATVGGASHTCTFAWTLDSGKYRLDTITWS